MRLLLVASCLVASCWDSEESERQWPDYEITETVAQRRDAAVP